MREKRERENVKSSREKKKKRKLNAFKTESFVLWPSRNLTEGYEGEENVPETPEQARPMEPKAGDLSGP